LAENPRPIHEVLLYGTEDGVWCALKATKVIQSTLFSDTENSEECNKQTLAPFF